MLSLLAKTALAWMIFAGTLAPVQAWSSRAQLARWQRAWSGQRLVTGALFDLPENLSASLMMLRYPEETAGAGALWALWAPVFPAPKWSLIGASFTLLVGRFSAAAWRWIQSRLGG